MWLFFEKLFLLPMQMPLNCIPVSIHTFHFMSWMKSTAFSHPRLRRGNYGEIFNRVCIIRKQHWILKSSHKWIKIYSVLLWWYMEILIHLFKLAYFVSFLFSHMMLLLTVPPVLQLDTHIIHGNCRRKAQFCWQNTIFDSYFPWQLIMVQGQHLHTEI